MNHAGEIAPLIAHGAAACGDRSPRSSRSISAIFRPVEAIANAKAEIFAGSSRAASAVINARQSALRPPRRRRAAAGARPGRRLRRATGRRGAAASSCSLHAERTCVTRRCSASALSLPDRRRRATTWRSTAWPCWRRSRRSASISARAAAALAQLCAGRRAAASACACRCAGRRLHPDRRELQRQPGLDARGARRCLAGRNRAGAAAGSPCSATCWSSARQRRAACRPRRAVDAAGVDLVFTAGPLMARSGDALPADDPRRLRRTLRRSGRRCVTRRCGPAMW